MPSPVLSVSNLSTSFRVGGRWLEVVRDVSFDIGARETVAVVGESGSGKSVTALSIMRLLSERNARVTGAIDFAGRNLLDHAYQQVIVLERALTDRFTPDEHKLFCEFLDRATATLVEQTPTAHASR